MIFILTFINNFFAWFDIRFSLFWEKTIKDHPADIYLFKVNNGNQNIVTDVFHVFIVNFKNISYIVLVNFNK